MIRIARVAAGAQKELDIAKTEMVKIAKFATAAQRELDIARGETRLLNKVINGLQQRLDRLEGRGSVRQRPLTPGVRLVGRQLGTWTRSRQSPRPRGSPQESSQRRCPLSQRPLTSQRGPS